MSLPLLPHGVFGEATGLALAVLIGLGFGFTLERGGFGSSRRLAAQFYLYDMTVFKVMFTAIVTAMVGLFGLARLGLLDLEAVWINPTFLWPQLAGGFLLGVGFIVSGYCPGTAIVASASGKVDGVLALVGVALGIFVYGAAYSPAVDAFQKSGSQGRLLLSEMVGVSPNWLALAVVAVAAAGFVGAEALEKRFMHRAEPGRVPRANSRARNAVMAALLLAGLAVALPRATGSHSPLARAVSDEVTPLDLARHLVEGTADWTVIDLRTGAEIAEGPMPRALAISPAELASPSGWEGRVPHGSFCVLVSREGGAKETPPVPEGTRAAILRGGYAAWKAEVLTLPAPPPAEAADRWTEYREREGLFSFFTGVAAAAPASAAPPAAPAGGGAKKKPAGGC
jgi:uncharacterized membrane protein YedE/YeeE